MVAAALLFAGCGVGWFIALAAGSRSLRIGLLQAFLVMGMAVLVLAETLSATRMLTVAGCVVSWVLVASAGWALAFRRLSGMGALLRRALQVASGQCLAAFVGVAAIPTFLSVYVSPNNWDSMTYHLPRIEHWVSQGSVSFYSTNIDRQLWSSPLAEYGALHARLLTDGDQLANCLQLSAWVVAAAGVSLLVRDLGYGLRVQGAAALLALTMPAAITQATTTQNDLIAAALVVSCVWGLMTMIRAEGQVAGHVLAMTAGSAALAVATKPTAVMFLAPFAVWWFVVAARRGPRPALAQAAILALPVLLLNAPHWVRTAAVFGSPLGRGREYTANEQYGLGVLVENIARNAAGAFAAPVVSDGDPGATWNDLLSRVVVHVLAALRLDANDPVSTTPGEGFAVGFDWQEDLPSNLPHLVLLVAAVVVLLRSKRDTRRQEIGFAIAVAAGFVVFSALLRWQPWGIRLLLPLLMLSLVPTSALLGRLPRRAMTAVVVVAVLGAVPWLLFNRSKPVSDLAPWIVTDTIWQAGRVDDYFLYRPELREPYEFAARRVVDSGSDDVALIQGPDDWEYPLWALLRESGSSARLRGIRVANSSAELESAAQPDMIICTVRCGTPLGWRRSSNGTVTVAWLAQAR